MGRPLRLCEVHCTALDIEASDVEKPGEDFRQEIFDGAHGDDDRNYQIVLEPMRRYTAPAVATAALMAAAADPDATLLVMPVDHLVRDLQAVHDTVMAATTAAVAGRLVLFGIKPTEPTSGFGYIKAGAPFAGDISNVSGFVEKPAIEMAEKFLSSGDYLWNSGIFLLPAGVFLHELERLAPDVLSACRAALAGARRDLDFPSAGRKAIRGVPFHLSRLRDHGEDRSCCGDPGEI